MSPTTPSTAEALPTSNVSTIIGDMETEGPAEYDDSLAYSRGVLYRLSRLQRLTRRRIEEKLGRYGMSIPAYAAMSVVGSRSPITNADLARASFVSPQTMNTIVNDLEERGYVCRQPAAKGRGLLIELTPTGELLLGRLVELQDEVLTEMVGDSGIDLEHFSDILVAFIGNMTKLR